MNSELLQQVIADQREMATRKGRRLPRHDDVGKHLKSGLISVITGVKRSGKSTLTLQIADHYDSYHFVNFDDQCLIDFKVSDFNDMLIEMKKLSNT
jgi:predicted AAA+ superfamily ATPase